ncbi:unnamed protein product [Aspergillus oryzae]|uniref:Unnamed protein product n=2 Tax=Aspergillus oryzae TaxID=5062 RepID=A0AAN5C312_ASPOZ|nr:unnamed protein product [Aspergillus oryzae]GMF93779.1 unnamed protein product [Aspergillus oryzae]GMG06304.1 unnamed protein product [Aspergillus oryzae]GMG35807.1 unnamed protein product [Aspergillus oryzae]GMG41221.1 unnamed protein product [Aspergillus oryzae var. brunneus]
MSRSAFSKPVDGVGSRKCVVMHGLKFPVSAAVRLVGIVFWIQSRTEDDAVSVGRGPEPHQHGHGTTSPWGHGSSLNTPESREREYSPVSARDTAFHDAPIDSLPAPSALEDLRASQTADQNGPESQQLSPNDMIAPVGAMHSMSVNLLGSNNVSLDICKQASWRD